MLRSPTREQLLAELAALAPAHQRPRAEALAARYVQIAEEIEERRKREAREDVHQAIEEALAAGELMKDRYGRLWPSEWLPVHNGEGFEHG